MAVDGASESAASSSGFRSSEVFVSVVVAAAVFTDVFLYGIIVPIAPFALEQRAGVPPEAVQKWDSIFLAGYGAAHVVGAPLVGWYADTSTSRKTPFLLGLMCLGAATALFWVALSPGVLAAARAIQGFSATVVWTVGLALLVDTVPSDRLGVRMSYVTIANMSGAMLGPLIGGVVFAKAGYHAVFVVALSLIACDIVLRLLMVEQKKTGPVAPMSDEAARAPNDSTDNDDSGRLMTVASALITDNDMTPEYGTVADSQDDTPEVVLQKPIIIFSLLRQRRFVVAIFAVFVAQVLLTSFDSILPTFVIETFGFDPLGSGLIFLPLTIPALASPLIGKAVDVYGPLGPCTLSFVAAFPAVILLRLVDHNSTGQLAVLCVLLFVFGLSHAAQEVTTMVEVSQVLDEMDRLELVRGVKKDSIIAQAYGLVGVSTGFGMLTGPLLSGWLKHAYGWGTATLVLGLLSGLTATLLFLARRKSR